MIIDEVEQVLWHLLDGDTCKQHRVRIIKTLKALLQKVAAGGGRIYLADADLGQISVSYIQALIGWPVESWIVENTYNPVTAGGRLLFWYRGNNPSGLLKRAEIFLEKEKKLLLFTDGQKAKTDHGTRNLEHHFRKKFPTLRILRVDSESLGDKNHPAYGCMTRLNELTRDYDLVLCSPALETGVSITNGHFDEIFVISHCVQTVEAVNQSLERDRSHVPRHIWCKGRSHERAANGSLEVKSLLRGTRSLCTAHIQQLQKAGIDEFDGIQFLEEDDDRQTPSLWAWAKRACLFNYQAANFTECLERKLRDAGYRIVEGDGTDDETKKEIRSSKEELYSEYLRNVAGTPNPDPVTYERLKEQRGKTEAELLTERKGDLVRRYETEEITPETVKKDDDGWYPKLKLHYYLTIGNAFLAERERKALAKLQENGDGTVFRPDVNRSQIGARIAVLKSLGIERFLDPTAEFTSYGLQEEFDRLNNPVTAGGLKTTIGVTLSPHDTPIAFYQRLLQQLLGLKLRFDRWETIDGKSRRVYRGCDPNPDERLPVLERWLMRDSSLPETVAG